MRMRTANNCRFALLSVAAVCLAWAPDVRAGCPPAAFSPCIPTLKAGFGPFRTSAQTSPNFRPDGKPVIADLKLVANKKSVVFGNYGGQLWVVNADGSVPAGMPLLLPADVLSTPAVGDLDGDGLPDIVVGYGSNFDGRPGGFRAFKNRGPGANPVFVQLWDHPSLDTTPPSGADPVFSSPAIGDLDGNGIAWVVVGSLDERIYCVKGSDGTDKPGWGPVDGNPAGGFWVGDTIYSSPALFDLDGDGKLEVIIGVDAHNQAVMPQGVRVPGTTPGGLVLAISSSGGLLPGFPIQLDQAISSSPAIGDIDGDGKPEIVIGTGNVYAVPQFSHKVYAFHCDGSAVLGWPVSVDGQVRTAPALADLDGDGFPDVVVTDDNSGPTATYHVYAFKGTGAAVSGWAGGRQPKDFFGQTLNAGDPVVADVWGDGKVEVLVPTNGEVCVFSNAGVQLSDNGTHPSGSFSFFAQGSVSGVAVDDLENDGVAVEVVAVAADAAVSKTDVYAWNPKAPGLMPWGQFRHDAKHTGVVPATPSCAPRPVVPTSFYPLTPCRVLDTRLAAGPLGGPALQPAGSGTNPRRFAVAGVCGIPTNAVSISANLAVTNVYAQGDLVVYPGDVSLPGTSAVSFVPGKTRANNAVVYLSATGAIFTVFNNSTAPVDFILDVNGYFR
jgi:hypothetical protein